MIPEACCHFSPAVKEQEQKDEVTQNTAARPAAPSLTTVAPLPLPLPLPVTAYRTFACLLSDYSDERHRTAFYCYKHDFQIKKLSTRTATYDLTSNW